MRPHKSLALWQESMQLVKIIYSFSNMLPPEEKYGLQSQLRRAAVSVPVNISEGAARKSEKEYLQFLYISRGSLSEVDTILEIIKELNLIEVEFIQQAIEKGNKVAALLNGLINKIETDNSKYLPKHAS